MTTTSCSASRTPLRFLCVGAGRDGTMSLAQMFTTLFEKSGLPGTVMHEYASRDFYNAFASLKETGDPRWMDEINSLIDNCPHTCIVGNGYAPILPAFAERCDSRLTLVHLQRADRPAAIRSLTKNCELFPFAYANYMNNPGALVRRMTAVHFGEMSNEAWDRLALREKLAWYLDKTHALIRDSSDAFVRYVEFKTEQLNDQTTRKKLAELVTGNTAILPPLVRINAHADVEWLPEHQKEKVQWLMGRLNLYDVANDDVYPLKYFAAEFVRWTIHQMARPQPQIGSEHSKADGEPQEHFETKQEIANKLVRAEAVLLKCLDDVRNLRCTLAETSHPAQ
jgi:hypothetical protein